jgi:signal transduction histidine kinase
MSQALRDPMNDILGMAELALQTVLSAEQREYLLTVKTEGDALVALINNLLDYTRSEFGELRLDRAPFSLRDLVRQAARPLFVEAEQMGLATAFELSPEIPDEVLGDAARLRQVLSHLLENAAKYTYEGAIGLKAECASRVDHQVELLFTLSDTGIGIPADKHQQIFEPFTNRRGGTLPPHAGNGLGLAISSRLVQLMGGRIWLESRPGRGSTFYFTVRLQLLPTPAAAAAN